MGNFGQLTFQNAWKHPSLIPGTEFQGQQNPWKANFTQLAEGKQKRPRKRKRDEARSSRDP
eukprot:6455715-Karenia_brevis.AAC.1